MITLNNINLSSIDLSGIDLRGIKLGLGGRGGGSSDGFPVLPGDVTRWHFGGLTNEMMAAMDDPRIEDADHKGRFLSFKNFAWKGMSGVGGYEMNFNLWRNNVSSIPDISMSTTTTSVSVSVGNSTYNNNLIYIHISNWDINKNHWLKVTSTYEDGDLAFIFYNDSNTKKIGLPANGYVNILAYPEFKGSYMYISTISNKQGSFTIEQLPLYPGALVFDGVDDYGTCDNFPILTKEKGYTVVALRQRISTGEGIRGLVSNVKNWFKDGAFILEYSYTKNSYFNRPVSFGAIGGEKDLPHILTYQTSKSYNGVSIAVGSFIGTDQLYVGKIDNIIGNCTNAAIWELVFLDHDATEEELTKIKDYFVKTYPWLFPDQAWTTVGKTNEDEDRATIANITGNGNDLVLSNFGFAGNSGYGEYGANYNDIKWIKPANRADITWTSYSINITSVKAESTQFYYQSRSDESSFTVPSYVIKVYGLKDGQTLSYRQLTPEGWQLYRISEDGIYTLPSFLFKANGDWYGFILNKVQESCDITIEQIPEYEGYLVTDGVDDTGRAVGLTISKDFTLVGEWILFSKTSVNAGLSIHPQIHIFNQPEAIKIVFRTAGKTLPVKSLKAICSDGRCYDENWSELKINVGEFTDNKGTLFVASNGTNYAQIAFKNLGIYDNHILSKDDCIKAYNYLQTLKAK